MRVFFVDAQDRRLSDCASSYFDESDIGSSVDVRFPEVCREVGEV